MVDNYQRIQDRKDRAQYLLLRADEVCNRLFSEGDLSGFLSLLCRLNNYDYRNLLLIYDQYPAATCLGAFRAWEAMLPNQKGKVLKDTAIGNGLSLLAPFTESNNGKPYLTWFHVLQFDVSQTNISYQPELSAPYICDAMHSTYLLDAVQAALSYLYRRSLLLVPSSDPAIPAQLDFRITREAVAIRSNTSKETRIRLLAEAMSELSAKQSTLPVLQHRLFCRCLCHCLMTLWQYPAQCPAPHSGSHISSVPASVQPVFLDALQQSVRLINETVACSYHYLRSESDDLLSVPELAIMWGFEQALP